MTSVWSRRPASSGLAVLFLLLIAATASARAVRLEPAVDLVGRPTLAAWFRADAEWLKTVPAPPDTLGAEDPAAALAAFLQRSGRRGPLRDTGARLLDRWHARGHLACRLGSETRGDTLRLRLDPGPVFRLGRLDVGGADFPGRDAALDAALPRPGDPVDRAAWDRAVAALLTSVAEGGRPYARWVVRSVSVVEGTARVDVTATLMPGPLCVFGPVSSDLPSARARAFLSRAARLPAGRPFAESELRRARDRLLQRGLYREVGEPVVHTTAAAGTVGVHFPVVPEPNPSRAAVMLGLSRADGDAPSRLSGEVDLQLANLAGTGRRLDVRWSDDGRERSHVGFGWLEPLVAGTPLDATLALDHEVERDAYTRFRVDGRLQLPVAGAWGVELGGGWDRSTFAAGDWTRSVRWRARAAALHRRTDRLRSGWSGTFAVETARRGVDLAEGATAGGGEERQTLVEVDLAGEQRLGESLAVAAGGLFREVVGDALEVPVTEQYRLGGARTLRGYLEDQFRGDRIAAARLELRLGRPGRSRVYTFFDLGYVRTTRRDPEDATRRIETESTLRGYGVGLETRTPAGDVSLAIGLPGTVDFDAAKLHVTLLQSF